MKGLPAADPLHIVSLLGRKKDGFSEFEYYPFRSNRETAEKPTFETWLNERYGSRFVVHEFPTTDAMGVPRLQLQTVGNEVSALLVMDHAVLVLDSFGAERTARICEAIGWKPSGFLSMAQLGVERTSASSSPVYSDGLRGWPKPLTLKR